MTDRIPGFCFTAPYEGLHHVFYFADENEAHSRADWVRRDRRDRTAAHSVSGVHSRDELLAKLRTLRNEYVGQIAANLATMASATGR